MINVIIQIWRRITWRLFTETRCAWCGRRVIRRAWVWPVRASHGMCWRCFEKFIKE
jgi:hypothetical protein